MEIYIPSRVLRETKCIVVAEALQHPENLQKEWDELPDLNRRYFWTFGRFKDAKKFAFLNNFHSLFPDQTDGSSQRKRQYTALGLLDLTGREWYEQRGILNNPLIAPSPLFLSQTGREFLQTIDNVITYYNIDTDLLKNLLKTGSLQASVSLLNRAHRIMFPSFVHLRALGYINQDLR